MGYLRGRTVNKNFIVQGKIPDEISIYSTDESIITREIGAMNEEAEIRPSFICDKESKTAHKTAKDWASGYGRRGSSYIHEDRSNVPWEGLKVWDLEVRGNGGRAYKVITPDGLYVDLREDTFLEAMLTYGIGVGGELPGQYVFAMMGSQMRLVRVGSDLHTALLSTTSRKKTAAIGTKELKVGGVYRSKSGEIEVFCGFVRDDDGKRKQFWLKPSIRLVDVLNMSTLEIDTTQRAVAEQVRGLGATYDHNTNKYISNAERVGISGVTLRTTHTFIEALGTINVENRPQWFYRVDIQKYPADYRAYGWYGYSGQKRIDPIWEERFYKFLD